MTISSRTPEGWSNHCPICGVKSQMEPSPGTLDGTCPQCGNLMWYQSAGDMADWRDEPRELLLVKLVRYTVDRMVVTRPTQAGTVWRGVASWLRARLADRHAVNRLANAYQQFFELLPHERTWFFTQTTRQLRRRRWRKLISA